MVFLIEQIYKRYILDITKKIIKNDINNNTSSLAILGIIPPPLPVVPHTIIEIETKSISACSRFPLNISCVKSVLFG